MYQITISSKSQLAAGTMNIQSLISGKRRRGGHAWWDQLAQWGGGGTWQVKRSREHGSGSSSGHRALLWMKQERFIHCCRGELFFIRKDIRTKKWFTMNCPQLKCKEAEYRLFWNLRWVAIIRCFNNSHTKKEVFRSILQSWALLATNFVTVRRCEVYGWRHFL